MLNNRLSFFRAAFFVILIEILTSYTAAYAQAPVQLSGAGHLPATVAETAESSLTVTGIVIDKTDKNAVLARDQAIVEARRVAFQRLAEKSMTPEAFKIFQLPADSTIMMLVQDFEIKNEQISANRYVASFTVRFSAGISDYIGVSPGTTVVTADAAPSPLVAMTPAVTVVTAPAVATPGTVLVLPYFENIAGKKLLWEDPNPWREAWQAPGNVVSPPDLTVVVPLGDIADVSSGSTDAVWAGDYSVLEKLRAKYGTDDVILTVANKSGIYTHVNLYIYRSGKLSPQKYTSPYTNGQDDKDFFKAAIAEVVKSVQALKSALVPLPPAPAVAVVNDPVAQPELQLSAPVAQPAPTPAAPPEKITLEATINFSTFTQWLEVQKRLSSISPPLAMQIFSLSRSEARFAVTFDGGLDVFRTALAGKGLMLNQPAVEIDRSALGGGNPVQRPVYELKMLN